MLGRIQSAHRELPAAYGTREPMGEARSHRHAAAASCRCCDCLLMKSAEEVAVEERRLLLCLWVVADLALADSAVETTLMSSVELELRS